MNNEFKLKKGADYIQLDQLLKFLGLTESGGDAHLAIDEGLVMVNNSTETQRRKKLRKGDVIEFEGNHITIV